MARPRVAKPEDKLKCLKCGSADQSNFYSTRDPARIFYQKIPYCKNCIKEFYGKYLKRNSDNPNLAIYYLCRKIDIPYVHENYLGAIKTLENPNSKIQGEEGMVSAYMKGFAFAEKNGWGNSFDDSQGEGEIEGITSFAELTKVKRKKVYADPKKEDDKYDVIEYDTQELIQKWGSFEIDDLAFLENEYLDWEEKLDGITEKSIDLLVKQVCYVCNEIRKDRENHSNTDKSVKTLMDLLKNSGLIEKQDKVNERKQIGMPIRDIEFKRPLKTVDPDLHDVDSMRDMIYGMTGGLCRSLGIENNYTEKLDEIWGKYGIDIIENNLAKRVDLGEGEEDG